MADHHYPLGRLQDRFNRRGKFSPDTLFDLKLFAPGAAKLVVFGAPVVFRASPLRLDPASTLQTMKGWIQRALLNLQSSLRNLLQPLRNAPTVLRLKCQRFQDQQIQRALRKLNSLIFQTCLLSSPLLYNFDMNYNFLSCRRARGRYCGANCYLGMAVLDFIRVRLSRVLGDSQHTNVRHLREPYALFGTSQPAVALSALIV